MKKENKLTTLLESAIKKIVISELSPKTRASAFSKASKDFESSTTDASTRLKRAQQSSKFLELPRQYHQKAQKVVNAITSEYFLGEDGEVTYSLKKETDGTVSLKIDLKMMEDAKRPNSFVWINIFTARIKPDGKIESSYNREELPRDMKDIAKTSVNRMLSKLLNDLKSEAVSTNIDESEQIKRMQELAGIQPIEEAKSYSNEFASWFTGTSLNKVKHPKFGKNKVTPEQMKMSPGDYKDKIFKEIEKYEKSGEISPEMVKKHSK